MRALSLLFVLPLVALAQREPLVFDIAWVNPPKDPPRGVTHHVFPSAAMKTDVGFNIYLPPEYASSPGKRNHPPMNAMNQITKSAMMFSTRLTPPCLTSALKSDVNDK